MDRSLLRRGILFAGAFLGLWLAFRYFFRPLLPFLLGLGLALAAEPAVRLTQARLGRRAAAALGVTLTLLLFLSALFLLGTLAVEELGRLAGALPDLRQTAQTGLLKLRQVLTRAADRLPAGIRPLARQVLRTGFAGGSSLLEQAADRLPGAITALATGLAGSALGIGTGILSAYMLSARLPRLRRWAADRLADPRAGRLLACLGRAGRALAGWLKAQLRLAGITWAILALGFLLLGVPYGPFLALPVALVDAIPVLGTGTVLLPWALLALLQGSRLRALGLVALYAAAMLTRTILEPRLLGRQLGLDPLLTLFFFYLGYRLWGFPGMLLSPMLAATVMGLAGASPSSPPGQEA